MKEVPIIAVSAHDTADFHAEALAAGCNEYVTKPIDFGELEDVIQELAGRHTNCTTLEYADDFGLLANRYHRLLSGMSD